MMSLKVQGLPIPVLENVICASDSNRQWLVDTPLAQGPLKARVHPNPKFNNSVPLGAEHVNSTLRVEYHWVPSSEFHAQAETPGYGQGSQPVTAGNIMIKLNGMK